MRERLTTLAGALLALAVVYGLFFAGETEPPPVTRPTTVEKGDNGYFALHEWLAAGNVKTYSLRERFTSLYEDPAIANASGNILATTLPYLRPFRDIESETLLDWVVDGNTLLILAAINDTPDWALATNTPFLDNLKTISGMGFESIDEEPGTSEQRAGQDPEQPSNRILIFEDSGVSQEFDIEPHPEHPLMNGVSRLAAASDFVSAVWQAEVDQFEMVLELASMQMTKTPALWQRKYGDGQIIVVGSGTMLTNRMIASADNRKFVANLVRNHLADGATFIFDDLHQGLSVIYDPDAFYSDSRLHYTIYFILGFWLLYIVGSSNRLLDPQAKKKSLRQAEFIEATGAFINRHMSRSGVGMWIYRSWFNDLRRHLGLELNGQPVWHELSTLTALDKRLLGKLQQQYEQLTARRKVNLIELHNTIHAARKAIG